MRTAGHLPFLMMGGGGPCLSLCHSEVPYSTPGMFRKHLPNQRLNG